MKLQVTITRSGDQVTVIEGIEELEINPSFNGFDLLLIHADTLRRQTEVLSGADYRVNVREFIEPTHDQVIQDIIDHVKGVPDES